MFQPRLRDRNSTPFDVLAALALQSDSMEVAERKFNAGYVSQYDYRWYCFFWTWTAARFGGAAASRQDRAYKRLGKTAYFRRIERAKMLYERWAKTRFGEYLTAEQAQTVAN